MLQQIGIIYLLILQIGIKIKKALDKRKNTIYIIDIEQKYI